MSWSFNGAQRLRVETLRVKICIKRYTLRRSLDFVAKNRFRWLEIVGERGPRLPGSLMLGIHVL
jgi:hypothetical protein